MKGLGRHLILELWGGKNFNSVAVVEGALRDAAAACAATLKGIQVYHYRPEGVTGVAVLAESHISMHPWSEYSYAAVDVFVCGDDADPRVAIPVLRDHFEAERIQVMEVVRGIASCIE